jgi:hypothetical protein
MVTMNGVRRFSYDVTEFVDVSHEFASPLGVSLNVITLPRLENKSNIK